jgi:hypothetical protein
MEIYILNHKSDCAVHNEPAFPKGKCDCDFLGVEDKISEIASHASYDEGSYEAASEAARTMLWECRQAILSQAIKIDTNELADYMAASPLTLRGAARKFLQPKLKGD